jgi:preprotein translocase subunit SecE
MSNKQPVQKRTSVGIVVWMVIVALIACGVWANEYFNYIDVSLRLIGWLVLVIVICVIALQSHQGKTIWSFAQDARTELRRVVWPTRKETLQTTMLVIGMVVLLGLIIWGIDTVLLHLMGLLTGQRG